MASTFVPVALASRATRSSNGHRGTTSSTGKYNTLVGIKPYVSNLTSKQIEDKWREPLAQEKLLQTHPIINMIQEKASAAVEANLSNFEEEERARINSLSEAELKVIKKQYVPKTSLLNRAKKGTMRAVGARTGNNSRKELLEFALKQYLPDTIRETRARLMGQYTDDLVAQLTPKTREIYNAEVDYRNHVLAGHTRATTGPGSTTYEWIDDAEVASRMANAGISGWGGRRTLRKRKTVRK